MTTKQNLSKHVTLDTSPARLARIWSGVSEGLAKHPAPFRRFAARGAAALLVTAAVVVAVFGVVRFRDPNVAGSPFHQAALETAARTPEMKALHADGALFIGRIKSYIVEEKIIVE